MKPIQIIIGLQNAVSAEFGTTEEVQKKHPEAIVVDAAVTGQAIHGLVAQQMNQIMSETNGLLESIAQDVKPLLGMKVRVDPTMVWFAFELEDGKTVISVAKKKDGLRLRKRVMGQLTQEVLGVSPNALSNALKSLAE